MAGPVAREWAPVPVRLWVLSRSTRGSLMPRVPMRPHNIRVPDKTWDAAQQAAEAKGENLSEEIRKFLERYGKVG